MSLKDEKSITIILLTVIACGIAPEVMKVFLYGFWIWVSYHVIKFIIVSIYEGFKSHKGNTTDLNEINNNYDEIIEEK